MCTTGTKGLRGWRTSEIPVAKNGLPASSAGVGGRIPSFASSSCWAGVAGWSTAAGYLSPHTAEKLQPPFSNTCPRSSLISPPPPPGRSHLVRWNLSPSSSSSRALVRGLSDQRHPHPRLEQELLAERGHGLRLADRRRDLGREILRRLVETFAQSVPREAADLDVLADHCDGGVDLVQHAPLALRILEEVLLDPAPAYVLEEPVELAGQDLVDHRLGLPLLEELRAVDALLPIDDVLRNVLAAHPP